MQFFKDIQSHSARSFGIASVTGYIVTIGPGRTLGSERVLEKRLDIGV
jgi:hypothetical protein